MHIAVREDVQTLNPYLASNPSEEFAVSLLYDTLLRMGDGGKLEPNLAERWELTADGAHLTCWLHPEARWHDGQPVTADDVAFSFNLVRQQQFPGLVPVVALMDRVEAVSPTEVSFVLLRKHADAVQMLCTRVRIVPQRLWAAVGNPGGFANLGRPVGSGPFAFGELTSGERLVLRNARYHPNTVPAIDALVLDILRDEDQALQALQDGELDALGWQVAPEVAARLRDKPDDYPGLKLAETAGWNTCTLVLNLRSSPYDGRTFRQALAQALDLQALCNTVLLGFADPATAGLFPPASPWRAGSLLGVSHDPERAAEVLDEAGVVDRDGDGQREDADGSVLRIPILCTDLPTDVAVAEAVAASWGALGIAAEAMPVAQERVLPALIQGQFAVALQTISLQEPVMTYSYFHSSRGEQRNGRVVGQNYGGYASVEYDEAATAALHELDPARRVELLQWLQEILAADLPRIPLYAPRVLNLYRDDHASGWSFVPGVGLLNPHTVAGLHPR